MNKIAFFFIFSLLNGTLAFAQPDTPTPPNTPPSVSPSPKRQRTKENNNPKPTRRNLLDEFNAPEPTPEEIARNEELCRQEIWLQNAPELWARILARLAAPVQNNCAQEIGRPWFL